MPTLPGSLDPLEHLGKMSAEAQMGHDPVAGRDPTRRESMVDELVRDRLAE